MNTGLGAGQWDFASTSSQHGKPGIEPGTKAYYLTTSISQLGGILPYLGTEGDNVNNFFFLLHCIFLTAMLKLVFMVLPGFPCSCEGKLQHRRLS